MDAIEGSRLGKAISHISFNNVKELNFNRNQIIWAPNGTGKTSIAKALKNESPLFAYADLEGVREDVVKRGKELVIGLGIRRIDELRAQNKSILKEIDVKKRLKAAGIANLTNAKAYLPEYARCTAEPENSFLAFKKTSALRLIDKLSYDNLSFYVANRQTINALPDLREEISELKSVFVNRALANLQNGIDAEEQTCPVCGREADRPILELIQERIGQYEASRQNLAADYSLLHPSLSAPEIEERLVGMGNLKASDLEILSYCIGQGDKSACEKVNQQKRQYTENQRTIERISNENEMFFNNLKMREKELRDLFTSRFGAGSVLLDDKEKQLVIALPRNIETYSTGETNLTTALVKINEFLASDKEVLVFDDPLSSLDRANQYFIMFELIRIGQQDQKKDKKENVPEKYATIFTHNMDCISIAESQFRSCFSYCCMERIGDNILFNPIPSNFFAVVKKACRNSRIFHQGANPGSLCAESILLYCKQVCATTPTNNGENLELDEEAAARLQDIMDAAELIPYLDLIMERDASREASSHEVFHYRKPFTKPGTELSNDRLVSAIESFSHTDIATHSFEARTVQKIFLILALRVWIEKQIYEAHPELLTQPGVGKQLGSLIKVAFDEGWKGPEDVTQEFLNAKKTMLNHNAHAKAQASPFDFAINLSIEDVRAEIEDVKKHFGAEPHPI